MNHEVREEFWQAFEKSPFIMMRREGAPGHAEPMTAQLDRDARHTIWFFTSRGNRIAAGGPAMGQMASKGHEVFACLSGTLHQETDPAVIAKHWSGQVDAWFAGGRHDPDMLMLRFEIDSSEVWTVDIGMLGKLKLLTGQLVKTAEMGEHQVGRV